METVKWLKDKASTLIEEGGYEEAIPYLDKLLDMPDSKPYDVYFAHFSLGQIYLYGCQWSKAQRHLRNAIEIGGEDPYVLLMMGQAYCAQGKHQKGRDTLELANELKPGDSEIRMALATCMCLQMDFDEADEIFRKLIEEGEFEHEPYVGLAQSLLGRNQWDEARQVLESAKEKFPMVLIIRQILKDLDKMDEFDDLYNWMMEDEFSEVVEEYMNLPFELARTAMAEMEFPAKAIQGAEKLWEDYLREGFSNPRVPEAWGAAIVYLFAKLYNIKDVTQAGLAQKFEVSPGSISRIYRKITDELIITHNDPRYFGLH